MESTKYRGHRLHRNNTSGFRGVHYQATNGMWIATIRRNGIKRYLGAFWEKEQAIEAREQAETELGER